MEMSAIINAECNNRRPQNRCTQDAASAPRILPGLFAEVAPNANASTRKKDSFSAQFFPRRSKKSALWPNGP